MRRGSVAGPEMGEGGRLFISKYMNKINIQEKRAGWIDKILIENPGAWKELTWREKAILNMRFALNGGESQTLEEIGKRFGVTRERIRQIEAKAIEKIYIHKADNI